MLTDANITANIQQLLHPTAMKLTSPPATSKNSKQLIITLYYYI